jgi:hypothetical protein
MRRCTTVVLGCCLLAAAIPFGCEPDKGATSDSRSLAGEPGVRGRLLYSNGAPAERVPVVLRSADPPQRTYRVNTGEDGRFALRGIPAGRYRLFEIRVYVNAKLGKCEVMARRAVTVGPDGLDLGTVKLAPGTIPPVTTHTGADGRRLAEGAHS